MSPSWPASTCAGAAPTFEPTDKRLSTARALYVRRTKYDGRVNFSRFYRDASDLTDLFKWVLRPRDDDPAMNSNRYPARGRTLKLAAAVVGAAALIALTVATTSQYRDGSGTTALAGSGDAPSNTTYTQPSTAAMTMGATATWSTPSSAPEVSEASPAIKAGS
jgi:hypothetical protein